MTPSSSGLPVQQLSKFLKALLHCRFNERACVQNQQVGPVRVLPESETRLEAHTRKDLRVDLILRAAQGDYVKALQSVFP
jgi:hypothetical protein